MIYLVQQIILCLLFTAMIGVAVGWLLRGLGTSRQTEMVEARWRARLEQAQQQAAAARPAPAAASAAAAPPAAATAPQQPDTAAEGAELAALRKKLAATERALATLQTAQAVRAQADAPGETIEEKLRESRIVAQQLQTSLVEQRSICDRLEKRLERAEADKKTVVNRLRDVEASNVQLAQERQHAMDTITGLQTDLRTLRNSAAEQREAADKAASHVAKLRAAASQTAAGRKSPQQPLPIAEAAEPEPSYEPQWQLDAPDGEADNLQTIYGIGPKTEQRLNALGIFHFRQLGAFRKRDIVWLTQHLHGIPGRISRDRWVEQARALEKRRQAGQSI